MKAFLLALLGLVLMSFWVDRCYEENMFFTQPIPADSPPIYEFPKEIAGVYYRKAYNQDSSEISAEVMRIELADPEVMTVEREEYYYRKDPLGHLRSYFGTSSDRQVLIQYTDEAIIVFSPDKSTIKEVIVKRGDGYWEKKGSKSVISYHLQHFGSPARIEGDDTIGCAFRQKNKRLYVNLYQRDDEDGRRPGWIGAECYDFQKSNRLSYEILAPCQFMELYREGKLSAASIRLDSTFVVTEAKADSEHTPDTTWYYLMLPTDQAIERLLRDTIHFRQEFRVLKDIFTDKD